MNRFAGSKTLIVDPDLTYYREKMAFKNDLIGGSYYEWDLGLYVNKTPAIIDPWNLIRCIWIWSGIKVRSLLRIRIKPPWIRNTGWKIISTCKYTCTIAKGGRITLKMLRRKSKTQFVNQERNTQHAIERLNYLKRTAPINAKNESFPQKNFLRKKRKRTA
jgi:hypothetical protein